MTPHRPRKAARTAPSLLVLGLAVVLGVLGTGGGLWATGLVQLPAGPALPPDARPLPRAPQGTVEVLISPQEIPAYTQLDRDLLFDTRSMRPRAVTYLPPEAIKPDMLVSLDKLVGRVLRRDKGAQYVFTESDLFPAGTRPGLVAGIPPGKVALRLEAEQLRGLYGLHTGDRFDVVATQAVDATAQQLPGMSLDPSALMAPWEKQQARVRTVVDGAVVVRPVHARQRPGAGSQFTGTASTIDQVTNPASTRGRPTPPVLEAVVAVAPEEVGALTEALALDAELMVLVRSGRSDDTAGERGKADRTPQLPFGQGADGGRAPFSVVETIQGGQRQWTAVPNAKGENGGR